MDQATRTAIATFHRYILACGDDRWPTAEALAMGGPEACWALCQQLLGCTYPMPAWLIKELVEQEGLAEESVTYHDAAVDMLTDHWLNEPEDTWVAQLYPVFVKVCEVNQTEPTREGFVVWLATMVDEAGISEAMQHWPRA